MAWPPLSLALPVNDNGDYLDRFPAEVRPHAERAYNDGCADGASYGDSLADDIRAALDDRAGPAENQLAAIRAALEKYEGVQ